MTQEGTEADDVACQQSNGQDDKCNGKDYQEFNKLTIVSSQLICIRYQETWQEEIVQQIDIQSSCTNILERLG